MGKPWRLLAGTGKAMKMKLDHGLTGAHWDLVAQIEEKHKAYFLGCFPVGGLNTLCFCFYQEVAHPRGSNYFGIYWAPHQDSWVILNAGSIQGHLFTGILKRGRIIYSRYRHDCRTSGRDMIDGGWDYNRHSVNSKGAKLVNCMIKGRELVVDGGANIAKGKTAHRGK